MTLEHAHFSPGVCTLVTSSARNRDKTNDRLIALKLLSHTFVTKIYVLLKLRCYYESWHFQLQRHINFIYL